MSDEHLLRELRESEEREDHLNKQNLAPKALGAFKPREIDHAKAMDRFNKEIAPVIARRKLAVTSKAYRLLLKLTGNWKGMEEGDVELVNPNRGFIQTGPTDDDLRAQITANPNAFKHLMRSAPQVQQVAAQHRGIEPRLAEEPRDES